MEELLTLIEIPDSKDVFELYLKESNENYNEFRYWYNRILKTNFNIPKSHIFRLSFKEYELLKVERDYSLEEMNHWREIFNKFIIENNIQFPIFNKTGLFSNKFKFNNWISNNVDELVYNIKDIYIISRLL